MDDYEGFTWSPSALIVDARGCELKDNFFIKELAFYNTATCEHWVGTFKPPIDRSYLRKKYVKDLDQQCGRTIGWDEGAYPYQMVFTMLNYFGKSAQLHALGSELCRWIQTYTSLCVVNLEELGCPRDVNALPTLSTHNCIYHSDDNDVICALGKAKRLGLYLNSVFSMITD